MNSKTCTAMRFFQPVPDQSSGYNIETTQIDFVDNYNDPRDHCLQHAGLVKALHVHIFKSLCISTPGKKDGHKQQRKNKKETIYRTSPF